MSNPVQLSSLAQYVNGRAFKPTDFTPRGLPVIRIAQLLNPTATVDRYDGPYRAEHLLTSGDLIFSWSGTLAVRRWTRGLALLNQHLFKVIPRAGVHPAWLRYVLESSLEVLRTRTHGTTMKHITRRELDGVSVMLPPFAEQRRVADLMQAVDRAAEASATAAAKARAVFIVFLDEAFRGAATHVRLDELATVNRGYTWTSAQERHEGGVSSLPVVRIGNVQRDGIHMGERLHLIGVPAAAAERFRLTPSSLLMVGSNGNPDRIGNVIMAGDALAGHLYASFLIGIAAFDVADAQYVWRFLQSRPTQAKITEATSGSTGLKNLALTWLRALSVPLTDQMSRQRVIGTSAALEAYAGAADRQAAACRALRATLLSDLLDGTHKIPAMYDMLISDAA